MRGVAATGFGPWKLQVVVAAVFAVIVLAIAGGLIWYNNGEVRRLVRADASARFDRVVDRVRDEFRSGLHLAEVVLDTSTLTIETDVPEDHLGVVMGGTLRDLEKVLPAASSFFVAWADGRFVLAQSLATARLPEMKAAALPGATYVLQFVDRRANGATARWVVTDAQGHPIGEPQTAPTDFDPRTRPWYEQATATTGAIVTEPYRFANMNQVGLTLARKSRLADDVVFGIDIGLASVDRILADLRKEHGLDLVVFSRSGELIAHPDGTRFRTEFREARADHLPLLTELGLADPGRAVPQLPVGRHRPELHRPARGRILSRAFRARSPPTCPTWCSASPIPTTLWSGRPTASATSRC